MKSALFTDVYPPGDNENDLNTLLRSSDFDAWLSHLADQKAKGQNPGSHNERDIWEFQRLRTCWRRRLGDAHSCGAGYRVYYTRTGSTVYVLLAGGVKASQTKDIAKAKRMARELKRAKP